MAVLWRQLQIVVIIINNIIIEIILEGMTCEQFNSAEFYQMQLRVHDTNDLVHTIHTTPRRRTSCGAQPADGVSILTPVS